jgi:Ala-tRNA(Pro) deacylase
MSADQTRLFARLAELGIASTTGTHAPMFTVEQSKALREALSGAHTKTLFLVDKDDHMVLVVAKDDSRVDLKALARRLRLGRFSFGKASLLEAVLGVSPGSVTPFALINDADARVKVAVDAALLDHREVNCHPLVNSATTRILTLELLRFIEACGHRPVVLPLGATEPSQMA